RCTENPHQNGRNITQQRFYKQTTVNRQNGTGNQHGNKQVKEVTFIHNIANGVDFFLSKNTSINKICRYQKYHYWCATNIFVKYRQTLTNFTKNSANNKHDCETTDQVVWQ